METLMFTFGVLTMIAVAIAIVIVIGAVKVFKLNKQVQQLFSYTDSERRDVLDQISQLYSNIENERKDMLQQVSDLERQLNQQVDVIHRRIDESISASQAYTNRRIDKLIDPHSVVQEAKKTLLKG